VDILFEKQLAKVNMQIYTKQSSLSFFTTNYFRVHANSEKITSFFVTIIQLRSLLLDS